MVLHEPWPQTRQPSNSCHSASSMAPDRCASKARHRSVPVPTRRPWKLDTGRGPAVSTSGGQVGADGAHDRAWHRLVAVGQEHDSVQRVGAQILLDLHRNQVAVEHRGGLHQVLAEAHDRKLHGNSAGFANAPGDVVGERVQRQVAGVEVGRRVGDPDHRPRAVVAGIGAGVAGCHAVEHRDLVVTREPAAGAKGVHQGFGTPRPSAPGSDWISGSPSRRATHSRAIWARRTFSRAIAIASASMCPPDG